MIPATSLHHSTSIVDAVEEDPAMIETEMSATEAIAMQAARRELDLQEARWQRQRASQLFHGGETWSDNELDLDD